MIIYVNVHFCFVSAKLQTDLKKCSVKKTSPELQPPPTSPPTKKQCTPLFVHYSLNAQQDPADEDRQSEKKLLSYIEAINSPAVSSSPTSVSAVAHTPEYAFLLLLFEHFLCTPASSAPVERGFSQSGLLLRPHRARMSDKLPESLVFLTCN